MGELRTFGKYRVVAELGRGGMGVVYRAHDPELARDVALKVIGGESGPDDVARFMREARAAGKLRHPNIVQVYDVGQHDSMHYFTMELVDGAPLSAVVARGQPLPPRTALKIVRDVALALAHAHAAGVIHRDIKPANILLAALPPDDPSTAGRDARDSTLELPGRGAIAFRPVVADFGLAKERKDSMKLTQSGMLVGTPEYMSPEQALGENRRVGSRSDQYSLGAVLYALLTGRPPFQADNIASLLTAVVADEPVSPKRLVPALHRDVETIVLKALMKEPEGRYSSARELAEDIDRYLRGESVSARPVGPAYHAWRWILRNRLVSAMAAVLLFAVTGAGVYAWTRPAYLRIIVSPADAEVTVDGACVASGERRVTAGLHHVVARLRDHHEVAQWVQVDRNERRDVSVTLPRHTGTLAVNAEPRGTVAIVDGVTYGTPAPDLRLPTGRHHIRLELEGCYTRDLDVDVRLDRPAAVHSYLPRAVLWHQPMTDFAGTELGDDYDGDGYPDLVAGYYSNSLVLVFASATGERRRFQITQAQSNNATMRWTDLNADGKRELLAAGTQDGKYRVRAYDVTTGKELWGREWPAVAPQGRLADLLVDADRDGVPDWFLHGSVCFSGRDGTPLWFTDDFRDGTQADVLEGDLVILTPRELVRMSARPALIWRRPLLNARRFWIRHGRLFLLLERSVAAIDPATGNDVWRRDLPAGFENADAYPPCGLLAGSRCMPLDPETGAPGDVVQLPFDRDPEHTYALEDAVLVQARDRRTVALVDGRRVCWKRPVSAEFACCRVGSRIILGSDMLAAINPDGTAAWEVPAGGRVLDIAHDDVDGDGREEIIAGLSTGEIVVVDEDGRRRWSLLLAHPPMKLHVLDLDGDGVKDLYASGAGVSRVSGPRVIWQMPLANGLRGAPVLLDADGDGVQDVAVQGVFPRIGRAFRCFSGRDGHIIWEHVTEHDMVHGFVLGDPDGDGRPDLLTSPHGVLRWLRGGDGTALTRDLSLENEYAYCPPLVVDLDGDSRPDILVFTWQQPCHAIAFSGRDGKVLWKTPIEHSTWTSPCLDGKDVLFVSNAGLACRLEGATGRILWTRSLGPSSRSGVALGKDAAYAITMDGTLHCFDPKSGEIRWQRPQVAHPHSTPVLVDVDGDGEAEILFGTQGVACLRRDNTVAWHNPKPGRVLGRVAVADLEGDGALEVLCGTDDGILVVLDARTGAERWRYTTGPKEQIEAAPVVADVDGDGIKDIIYGGYDQKLTCISGRGPKAVKR